MFLCLDYDFFWLGRVPCRSVKLVGMVVGVIVYEKRIIYTSNFIPLRVHDSGMLTVFVSLKLMMVLRLSTATIHNHTPRSRR